MQHKKIDLCILALIELHLMVMSVIKLEHTSKALAAFDNNIPFYVSAPISSIDFNIEDGVRDIPIEERISEEVSHISGIDENNL